MNNNHLFPTLTLHFIITIFFFFIVLPLSHCNDDEDQFSICSSSPYLYRCGSKELNISYPFWGGNRPQYCGHEGFGIECQNTDYYLIGFGTQKFGVLNISASRSVMTIARDDLWYDYCLGIVTKDPDIDSSRFKYTPNVRNVSFFHDCDDQKLPPGSPNIFNCTGEAGFYMVKVDKPELQLQNLTDTCRAEIKVPVLLSALNHLVRPINLKDLQELLNEGFEVEYMAEAKLCADCNSSGGICGSDPSASSEPFRCFCRDHDEPQKFTCPPPRPGIRPRGAKQKIILAIFGAIMGTIVTCTIICLFKLMKKSITSTTIFRKRAKKERDLEAFIRNFGSLAPKRYSYSDVKKMTNSFKDKLGQGGYGGVFKGKLRDGQLVAVKLLNTSKGNGEEFINEVASISRTSHVNVVMLLGFCLEGKQRALVYEFMANGSLEQFIHNNDALKTNRHLGWEKLYQIALGITRGLEYLHRGCNTRILHFDIKPHNILLDESFCPKISDFGLAKLCPRNESMVSMLEARGTIGYIAPEIFSRNFGEVSHKSDVYSYGMMILEMVGGRKNLHLGVENPSEIYFPKWVYRHFELDNEMKFHDGMTEEENEIAKRLIIVGLWCIQARPLDRPSMNKISYFPFAAAPLVTLPVRHSSDRPPSATQPISSFCRTTTQRCQRRRREDIDDTKTRRQRQHEYLQRPDTTAAPTS